MAKKALLNRLERIETMLPPSGGYELAVTIIVSEETTDDEIAAKTAKNPSRRYVRFSDFADECI